MVLTRSAIAALNGTITQIVFTVHVARGQSEIDRNLHFMGSKEQLEGSFSKLVRGLGVKGQSRCSLSNRSQIAQYQTLHLFKEA